MQVVTKRIKFQGLIVGDYYGDKELMHAFQTDMARYVQEGKVCVCAGVKGPWGWP